ARRERTLLLRARPPALPLHVPLTARGAVQLGAGVQLDATGTQPPGWGCAAAPPPALANLALFPGATVSGAGPATLIDIGDSVETALLSSLALATSAGARILNPTLRHASLVAPTLAASVGSPAGHCALGAPADSAPSLAWGDPARPAPCADYLPYVHVQGDLTGPAG